ncbi:transposase [Aquibacillus albus]|uniref:Transposase n=1 Tax=Aquibacillus albus TaxID=1168171 RepID=A0ABS2N499_9BACI|nr:transposase [Aquibacillus albus]
MVIAKELETSAVTIRNILSRHNAPKRKTRKLSLEQEKEIISLYQQGKTSVELERLYPLTQRQLETFYMIMV